jgi:hypothetical protein
VQPPTVPGRVRGGPIDARIVRASTQLTGSLSRRPRSSHDRHGRPARPGGRRSRLSTVDTWSGVSQAPGAQSPPTWTSSAGTRSGRLRRKPRLVLSAMGSSTRCTGRCGSASPDPVHRRRRRCLVQSTVGRTDGSVGRGGCAGRRLGFHHGRFSLTLASVRRQGGRPADQVSFARPLTPLRLYVILALTSVDGQRQHGASGWAARSVDRAERSCSPRSCAPVSRTSLCRVRGISDGWQDWRGTGG